MDRFHFYENDDEKTKNETIVFNRFFKEIVFQKRSFYKKSFLKTTIFVKFVVSLTIINDNPSLTIVNEERRREENDLKGIGTYH